MGHTGSEPRKKLVVSGDDSLENRKKKTTKQTELTTIASLRATSSIILNMPF